MRVITQNMKTHRWDQQATIVSRRPNGPSYVVDIDGRKHIRNWRFLRPSLVPDQTDATGPVATIMTSHDVATRPNTTGGIPDESGARGYNKMRKIWAATTFKSGGHDETWRTWSLLP